VVMWKGVVGIVFEERGSKDIAMWHRLRLKFVWMFGNRDELGKEIYTILLMLNGWRMVTARLIVPVDRRPDLSVRTKRRS
jgi:hypothetical protein